MRTKLFWTYLSWILTIISFITSFYFYEDAKRERIPTFFEEPFRTEIVSKNLVLSAPIKIYDSEGLPIATNVYSTKFYFFNQGKEPIKDEDILKPLFIQLSDDSAKILSVKLIKVTREVTGLTLQLDSLLKNTLSINFKILEQNDGCIGQIIYQSDREPLLKISGTIEGSGDAFTNEMKLSYPITFIVIIVVLVIFSIALFVLLLIFLERLSAKLGRPNKSLGNWLFLKYILTIHNANNPRERTSMRFTYFQVIIASIALFTILHVLSYFTTKSALDKWINPNYPNRKEIEIPSTLKQ
ncbi:hypothetical protein [Chryseolinea lacunae]|uniref:Uncharacterized protein n=1 Tax=Chryseolinea lacunae TaxID=2801331 RepID=A0ABS1KPT9_9BACT|nr:hypothetical protein [Chryseolinea lacunae]MBL0741364.1 hypothetical protein [Chryseolinea lacunae]